MAKKYGRWVVIKSLNQGAQSHVFLVRDEHGTHTEEYALKRLKSDSRLDRFKREIEARKQIDIQGIPNIIDSDTTSSKPYFVEEYIDGGDLSANLGIIRSSHINTLWYFLQICQIIDATHRANLVHRDIKPKNILYDKKKDQLYVTDFGLCFHVDNDSGERFTAIDEQVGTRGFTAPELEKGGPANVTPAADVYSLGLLLYWMYTGKKIYREDYRSDKTNMVLLEENRQLERVNQILDMMIVEDPDYRKSLSAIILRIKGEINLMKNEYNVISDKVPQICIYCGKEKYSLKIHDPVVKNRYNDGLLGEYGLPNVGHRKVIILECKFCGNTQFFFPHVTNKSWENGG